MATRNKNIIHSMNKKYAFSMVELAISLSVIGLLTIVIIGASKLMESANANRVTQEYYTFKSAVESFRDAYGYLPGDYPDAYNHWGVDVGCLDSSVLVSAYTGCNGDGDGIVELIATGGEGYKVVQHLSQSEIVPGNFPILGARLNDAKTEFFPSRITNGYYYPMHTNSDYPACWSGVSTSHGSEDKCGRHKIFLGLFDSSTNVPDAPSLTPLEVQKIDDRIDDGSPWTGNVQIRYLEASSCNGVDAVGVGSYDVTASGKLCLPMFFID